MKSLLRKIAHEDDASEIAEAALVLPMAFMLLLAVFWFGQAFRIYGTINHAAREGARAATAPACSTCASTDPSQNAYNAIQSTLAAAKLDPAQLQQPTTIPSVCSCTAAGTVCTGPGAVACDSGQANICVQGVNHAGAAISENNIRLSSTTGGNGAGVCGVSVSFQYPYNFWLPFTSLNKQTIHLQAQAQMRVETQ
jgi:Flp pilus assembly protein TadG